MSVKFINISKYGNQEIEQLDEYLKLRETNVTRIKSGPVNGQIDWETEEFNRILIDFLLKNTKDNAQKAASAIEAK